MEEIVVFVCDTRQNATAARNFLLTGGYLPGQITNEKCENFIYDAATHGGGTNDAHSDKWIVIGRK